MSFDKDLKKYEKIGSGFLLFLAGMSLAQCYDAYHTLKEYDKLSLAQELGEDDSLTFSVFRDEKSDNYFLSVISSNSEYKLNDEDYEKLNQILSNEVHPISMLSLSGLGDEVDFSKVDLSAISDVYFQAMQDDFVYTAFFEHTFDFLCFSNVSINDSLKEFLKSTNLEYSTIEVSNEDLEVISYLEEVGKTPNILNINVYGGFYGDALPEFSAREVNMHYYFKYHQLLDIDVSLSDKVEEANFSFSNLSENSQDISFDDVSVDSNNSDLELSFVNVDRDNLSMELCSISSLELPDGSYATFENIDCTDNSLFTSLENLSGFSYSDGQGKEVSYIDKNSSNPAVKCLRYR